MSDEFIEKGKLEHGNYELINLKLKLDCYQTKNIEMFCMNPAHKEIEKHYVVLNYRLETKKLIYVEFICSKCGKFTVFENTHKIKEKEKENE